METKDKKATFGDVINGEQPVLVDFFATWCGPCKMLSPVLEQLAKNQSGKLRVVKLDVEKNPSVSQAYRVTGVPTMILFKNGKQLWRQSGYMNVNQLEKEILHYI